MFNFIVYILCTIACIIQWNNNWTLFAFIAIFAVLNLIFAIPWIKTKMRKIKHDK